jgi:hypothetical protein
MLIPNCLFRSNGSAVLLSNRARDAARAKYSIRNIVRTNLAADDVAFNCVMQTEDDEGKVCASCVGVGCFWGAGWFWPAVFALAIFAQKQPEHLPKPPVLVVPAASPPHPPNHTHPQQIGVRLNKDLIIVGAKALRQNMTALGPLVLPLSEQALFAANFIARAAAKQAKPLARLLPAEWLKPYTPDFRKAFSFYCIHTGGRGIIDGLEKEMGLARPDVEPSRASLYRFGNTSSTR